MPLVIVYPGVVPEGRRIEATFEPVDLFPTVAELVGVPVPEGLPGRSLAPQLTGAVGETTGDGREVVVLEAGSLS